MLFVPQPSDSGTVVPVNVITHEEFGYELEGDEEDEVY